MMMEGKGLEVIDLGTDVSPETYVETAVSPELPDHLLLPRF